MTINSPFPSNKAEPHFSVYVGTPEIAVVDTTFPSPYNGPNKAHLCLIDPQHVYIGYYRVYDVVNEYKDVRFATNASGSWVDSQVYQCLTRYGAEMWGMEYTHEDRAIHIPYLRQTNGYWPTELRMAKSTNNGASWATSVIQTDAFPDAVIGFIEQTIYSVFAAYNWQHMAIVCDSTGGGGNRLLCFYTHDGGATWTRKEPTVTPANAGSGYNIIHPESNIIMFSFKQTNVMSPRGVWRTSNGGTLWGCVDYTSVVRRLAAAKGVTNYGWMYQTGVLPGDLQHWNSFNKGIAWAFQETVSPTGRLISGSEHHTYYKMIPNRDGYAVVLWEKTNWTDGPFGLMTTIDNGAHWIDQGDVYFPEHYSGNQKMDLAISYDAQYGGIIFQAYGFDKNLWFYPLYLDIV